MEEDISIDNSEYSDGLWIDWFLGSKGNEYFCDIDTDFITDRFNLTGLNSEVSPLQDAIDIITDRYSGEFTDEESHNLEKMASHLYGLAHARYILTTRGMQKMIEKYKNSDFGRCPRVYCHMQPLLPIGFHDLPRMSTVKLYCPKCEDVYNPKSSRHAYLDGAYFGTSFPGMLLQVYPNLLPAARPTERYVPKIFGFKLHEHAKLARWQAKQRSDMENRLKQSPASE